MGEYLDHPSYGQISISRVTSTNSIPFYGSQLKHSGYVELEIKHSRLYRSLHEDKFYDGESIVRVRMTAMQFSQMITSLNIGGGTPVTLTRLNGKMVEDPPFRDEREEIKKDVHKKAKKAVTDLTVALQRLQELSEPNSKVSKVDLREITTLFRRGVMEVEENIPFIVEQFEEAVDVMVADGRADIEAHLADAIARIQKVKQLEPTNEYDLRVDLLEGEGE